MNRINPKYFLFFTFLLIGENLRAQNRHARDVNTQADSKGEISGSGNGGDAWVCFSIPLTEALDKDRKISTQGRAKIETAVPFEIYLASGQTTLASSALATMKEASFEESLEYFEKIFESVPYFKKSLGDFLEPHDLGLIEDGYGFPASLTDISDGNPVISDDKNCAQVQAVVRQLNSFVFDSDIWSKFSPFHKAVMQLHEQIYFYSKEFLGHRNSIPTQYLIVKMITLEAGQDFLVAKYLKRLGFGSFDTKTDLIQDWKSLQSDLDNLSKDLETIRSEFVEQKLEQELEKGNSILVWVFQRAIWHRLYSPETKPQVRFSFYRIQNSSTRLKTEAWILERFAYSIIERFGDFEGRYPSVGLDYFNKKNIELSAIRKKFKEVALLP